MATLLQPEVDQDQNHIKSIERELYGTGFVAFTFKKGINSYATAEEEDKPGPQGKVIRITLLGTESDAEVIIPVPREARIQTEEDYSDEFLLTLTLYTPQSTTVFEA